jgi:hypothetical protein
MTVVLNIFKFLTDPKNTRLIIFGVFVILCLLLVQQCNQTNQLKEEVAHQKDETTRLVNNEEAKNAVLVQKYLKDSTLRGTIQGYRITQEELINEYSHLMSGFEDLKGQAALALAKGTITIRETLYVQTQAKIDEYGSGQFTASDTLRVDADNYRIFSFNSPFTSKFFQKTDSSEVDFKNYGIFQQVYPGKSKIDIQQSMSLKVGLFQDPKDKKVYISAQTKYPGVTFTKLEGADILADPESKKTTRSFRSPWGLGVQLGVGPTVSTTDLRISPGIYFGIGLNYSPKRLQWGK